MEFDMIALKEILVATDFDQPPTMPRMARRWRESRRQASRVPCHAERVCHIDGCYGWRGDSSYVQEDLEKPRAGRWKSG